jgi:sorting nexin-8
MVCPAISNKQSDLNPWGSPGHSPQHNQSSLPLPSPPSFDNTTHRSRSSTNHSNSGHSESDPWTTSNEASNILASSKPADKRENITDVRVEICTEKAGSFLLKHVNYKVFSIENENDDSFVMRRYSDFIWLQEYLTKRFPFRLLPALPPKKIGPDQAFLEQRRRGLARFLSFIASHPVIISFPYSRPFHWIKSFVAYLSLTTR